jgi:hypothetical protein
MTIDGTRRIVGKFCEIESLGPVFDIWLVKPDREPIGTLKLKNLIRAIESLPEYECAGKPSVTRLDGEVYLSTTSIELVRSVALLAGVKRRRRVSEATRQASAERLARMRAAA